MSCGVIFKNKKYATLLKTLINQSIPPYEVPQEPENPKKNKAKSTRLVIPRLGLSLVI